MVLLVKDGCFFFWSRKNEKWKVKKINLFNEERVISFV